MKVEVMCTFYNEICAPPQPQCGDPKTCPVYVNDDVIGHGCLTPPIEDIIEDVMELIPVDVEAAQPAIPLGMR